MTLRSCGSVSELRRRSRVRASRKRKRSADFPVLLVQLLAAIIGSLIVSKRNHFTLVADRHSVHTGVAHIRCKMFCMCLSSETNSLLVSLLLLTLGRFSRDTSVTWSYYMFFTKWNVNP